MAATRRNWLCRSRSLTVAAAPALLTALPGVGSSKGDDKTAGGDDIPLQAPKPALAPGDFGPWKKNSCPERVHPEALFLLT